MSHVLHNRKPEHFTELFFVEPFWETVRYQFIQSRYLIYFIFNINIYAEQLLISRAEPTLSNLTDDSDNSWHFYMILLL